MTNPNWVRRAATSSEVATSSSVNMSYSGASGTGCNWAYVAALFREATWPTTTPTPTLTPTFTPTITPTPTATVPAAPSGQVWRSYYFAGSQRFAMRVAGDSDPDNNGVFYLLGDHLGSTSVLVDNGGGIVSEQRYKPWGEMRSPSGIAETDYRYTGQREEASFGLYYYRARWYDPVLGRFAQADTIVAGGGPIAWDRYAYGSNNPVKYSDPTGHKICDELDAAGNCWNPPTGVALTHAGDPYAGKKRKYGGDEVAALFGLVQLAQGSQFSLEHFVGMYVWREGNIDLTAELLHQLRSGIAQAIAQQLYVGADNPAYNRGWSVNRAAVFNMIAAYIEPAHHDIDRFIRRGEAIPSGYIQRRELRQYPLYGAVALSRWSLVSDRFGGPSQWGNREEWTAAVREAGYLEGEWYGDAGPTGVYFFWDSFFIVSVSQREYWNDNH